MLDHVFISGSDLAAAERCHAAIMADIAWSLAVPDAGGQQLRRACRVGFPALFQVK